MISIKPVFVAVFGIIAIVYLLSTVLAKLGKRQLGLTQKKENSWISYFEHHQQRLSPLHLLV
jgi:hypothetical protein